MVVLCSNPACGAVLRVGHRFSPTEAVLQADASGRYFDCPRCGWRNDLPEPAGEPSFGRSGDQPMI
jgi:hypothetical protein